MDEWDNLGMELALTDPEMLRLLVVLLRKMQRRKRDRR